LRDSKIVIEATLQICNLARHVQKALRHMAIFTTIIQQPLAVHCNIDSAFCAEQSKQFILVLRDGIPLMSDWIGFPTLYYLPLPQSVTEIQLIRGGSSLLYGPEPAVNFVTKHPEPGSPWNFYTEQVGGPYGLYSTYNVIQEAVGPLDLRLDGATYARMGNVTTASLICGNPIFMLVSTGRASALGARFLCQSLRWRRSRQADVSAVSA
jgi:Fe(3+) dicitrate transport protein